MGRRILLAGASGLVGSDLLKYLLKDPGVTEVRALVRRPLNVQNAKLKELNADFEGLEALGEALAVDEVYCALGSTIKKAGSEEAFRKVDYEYPLALAKAAKARGARAFHLVSALGADAGSKVFYLRVKGELERDLAALGFERFVSYRPSLLLGGRTEFRPSEFLGQLVFGFLRFFMIFGKLRHWRAIESRIVAWSIAEVGRRGGRGNEIFENERIEMVVKGKA